MNKKEDIGEIDAGEVPIPIICPLSMMSAHPLPCCAEQCMLWTITTTGAGSCDYKTHLQSRWAEYLNELERKSFQESNK